MKTIHTILAMVFFLMTIPFTAFCQDIDLEKTSGCVVSEVKGKVTFMEKSSNKARPVKSGTILPEEGTIKVKRRNSSFTLAYEDRLLSVKKGTYSMASLIEDAKLKGEQSRFAEMMFAAKGYGGGDTTKRKGWGDKDSILFNIPIKGKIPLQSTTFKWSQLEKGVSYKVIVYQKDKNSPIVSSTTSNNSFMFDPVQLKLKTGEVYRTQVMLADDSNVTSEVVSFNIVSPEEVSSALTALQKSKDYQKSNALNKTLMEAVELESRGLNSLARERYQDAIKMDSNNDIARQMYAAFLDRIKN